MKENEEMSFDWLMCVGVGVSQGSEDSDIEVRRKVSGQGHEVREMELTAHQRQGWSEQFPCVQGCLVHPRVEHTGLITHFSTSLVSSSFVAWKLT
jgi:hypothetical protein